jgi:hypothetical protein
MGCSTGYSAALATWRRCIPGAPMVWPPHPTAPKDSCISILTGQLLLLRPSVRRAVLRLSARGLRAWIGERGQWLPESRPPGLVRLKGAWPRARVRGSVYGRSGGLSRGLEGAWAATPTLRLRGGTQRCRTKVAVYRCIPGAGPPHTQLGFPDRGSSDSLLLHVLADPRSELVRRILEHRRWCLCYAIIIIIIIILIIIIIIIIIIIYACLATQRPALRRSCALEAWSLSDAATLNCLGAVSLDVELSVWISSWELSVWM